MKSFVLGFVLVLIVVGVGVYLLTDYFDKTAQIIKSADDCGGSGRDNEFCAAEKGATECPDNMKAVPDKSCTKGIYSADRAGAKAALAELDQNWEDFQEAVDADFKDERLSSDYDDLPNHWVEAYEAEFFGYCCKPID